MVIKVLLYKIKRFFINTFSYCKWRVKFVFFSFYNPLFSKTVREQNRDFKKIPILIINFNQLYYLKNLINSLVNSGYKNIVIVDNNSTYPPLLEYYNKINTYVEVLMRKTNDGHRVFWKNKELFNKFGKGYYVITDADIELTVDCPDDFMLHFKKILDSNNQLVKVGFSLKIDDIPDSNKHKRKIINWENQFWKNTDANGNYRAVIDTTFALYRPMNQFCIDYFYEAIRTKAPYIAKHGGWYVDHNNLTQEQEFYMKTASQSSSWKVGENRELIKKIYEYHSKKLI